MGANYFESDMNSYTKHHISKFVNKYNNRSFDQDDVALLIVLVRDYTPKGSIFRELGDFIAHPDKKDRGLVIDSYNDIIKLYDEQTETFFIDDIKIDIKSQPGLGLLEEIQLSLSNAFSLVDLSCVTGDKYHLPFRDFVFCLIFLLSNFKLEIGNKLHEMTIDYGHSISLTIAYESKKYERHFISLPVLFLGNVNTQSIYLDLHKKLVRHIARRFDNGLLGAISYDVDNSYFNKTMSELPRGTVWPLPDYR
ncbi:hypothetical protein [Vibrio furnissii]|uniref:hypothetical protein n=1 Tax=Vibrio furnissii TaxID=29494 RepID=UPI00399B665F